MDAGVTFFSTMDADVKLLAARRIACGRRPEFADH